MSMTQRLAMGLIGLAALRTALAFVSTSAGWAFDGFRFIPPVLGVVLAAASFVLLVPAIGRRVAAALESTGDALARGELPAIAGAVALVEALVLFFPDRTLFVGDALLRNTVATMRLELLTPGGPGQLLPVDRLLHVDIPRWLEARSIANAATWARALGAVEAAGLAILAVAWVRILGLRGVSAVVAWVATVGGGYLLLFGGYGKASVEMTLVVLAVAALAVRLVRQGVGRGALGWMLVLAVVTHRSALLLLPAAVTALVLSWRGGTRRDARDGIPWAMLVVVLAALAPRLLATFTRYDVGQHLAPGDIGLAGGLFAASTGALRALDLMNLAVWMAPLLPLIPVALRARGEDDSRGEALVMAALVVPQVAMLVLLLPHQGLPRDWDVFAPAGCVLAAWTAAVLARAVTRTPEAARLGGALVVAVLAPLVAAFVTQASVEHGLARVRTFVAEPPPRAERVQAMTWDFLASRYHDLLGPEAEAEALRRSAELAPNPRVLWGWGQAAERAGKPAEALDAYRRLVARDSSAIPAWTEIARLSFTAGDTVSAWRAAARLRALDPDDPNVRLSFDVLDSMRRAAIRRGTWKE